MAARYWVGGSGTWDAADTSHWSATSGGAGGASVPTASDDVFFDASSGAGTATLGAQGNTRNLDCTGYTGTLNVNGVALNCNPAAGGLVRFSAGMTLTGTSSLGINTTSGAAAVLTSNGKTLPGTGGAGCNISGTGTVQLADAMTCAGTVTLSSGTLDLNGKTCTWGGFSSSNSNVRTLTTGAATITSSGAGNAGWWIPTATNMTVNASGSTINLTGANVQFYAGFAWWDVNFTGGGGPFTGSSGTSFRNLSVAGTAVKTDYFGISVYNITVSGTFTANGNSATNRLLIRSLTGGLVPDLGNARTITAGATAVTNADFMDITGAGAATWSGTSLGDCGGNSNITFTPAVTRTHTTSAGGNWSDSTKWSPAATNYVTNPSFTTNTTGWGDMTGWFVNTGSVTTRDTTTYSHGTASGKVVTDGSLNYEGKGITLGTLAAGTYYASIYLKGNAGGEQTQLVAGQGNGTWGTAGATLTTGWVRYTVTFTTDGTATCYFGVRALTQPTMTWFMDAAMVTEASTTAYFDGSSTECVWTGTANASTSTYLRAPLPQDDVVVDANTSGTLTADMPRLGKSLTFTGFAGTFTWSTAVSSYGNVTMASGCSPSGGSNYWTLAGRGSYTLTSAGCTWGNATRHAVTAYGGTYTLGDAYTQAASGSPSIFSVTLGSFSSANYAMTVGTLFVSGGTATLGTSTITLNATSGTTYAVNVSGGTVSAASATFVVGSAWTTARTFAGNGNAFGTLTYTVATSPGSLALTGANTFTTLNAGSGRQVIFPASTTTRVTNLNVTGVNNGYIYLPGVVNSNINTPNSVALSITGDLDMRARLTMDDWTPAATQCVIGKYDPPSSTRAYGFNVAGPGGQLSFYGSSDGVTVDRNASSSVAPTIADGAVLWIRVTRRISDGRVQFFTASGALTNPTAGDFTQLGTDQSTTAGALFAGTSVLWLGTHAGGTSMLAGKVYRAQVYNGLDGTLVFDADFTTKTFGADTFAESSSNTALITIYSTLAQTGDGRCFLSSSTNGTTATVVLGAKPTMTYAAIKDITFYGPTAFCSPGINKNNVAGAQFSGDLGLPLLTG